MCDGFDVVAVFVSAVQSVPQLALYPRNDDDLGSKANVRLAKKVPRDMRIFKR